MGLGVRRLRVKVCEVVGVLIRRMGWCGWDLIIDIDLRP